MRSGEALGGVYISLTNTTSPSQEGGKLSLTTAQLLLLWCASAAQLSTLPALPFRGLSCRGRSAAALANLVSQPVCSQQSLFLVAKGAKRVKTNGIAEPFFP